MQSTLPLLLSLVLQQSESVATLDSLLKLNDGTINWVAFSPDGRSVAACGDRVVQIFDIDRGKRTHQFAGHTKVIRGIDFSRDGRRLVSASDDNTMRVWQVRGDQEPASENGSLRVIQGYAGPGNFITKTAKSSVAFSRDGRMIVSTCPATTRDGGLMLWTVKTGQWEYSFRPAGPVYVTVSPSGKLVAIAEQLGRVSLYEWKDFGLRLRFGARASYLKHVGDQTVSHVAFSPDDRKLVSVCLNDTIRIWDVKTGKSLFKFVGAHDSGDAIERKASISEDDHKAAATMLRKFDREKDGVIDKIDAYNSQLPDARAGIWFEYDADQDKLLTVKELARYQLKLRLDRERAAKSVVAAEFLPDGDRIVAVTRNETIRLWDPKRGTSETVAQGSEKMVRSMSLSPDGKTLATCGLEGVVKLWAIKSPEE
jgi:WD40 repeat protein